jgi:hypothetical protein
MTWQAVDTIAYHSQPIEASPSPAVAAVSGFIVACTLVALTEAWQQMRHSLSWHDRAELERIARFRNGVSEVLPWHRPSDRINQVPVIAPLHPRPSAPAPPEHSSVSPHLHQPAHEHQAIGVPELQPLQQSPDGSRFHQWLTDADRRLIQKLAADGVSLNQVCKEMGISKGSSPKYQELRAAYYN